MRNTHNCVLNGAAGGAVFFSGGVSGWQEKRRLLWKVFCFMRIAHFRLAGDPAVGKWDAWGEGAGRLGWQAGGVSGV